MATVAEKWKRQYFSKGRWGTVFTGDTEQIYAGLVALPASATPDDVKAVIGTHGWVTFVCDGCGTDALTAIQLGDPPDYESRTVTLCLPCFDAAVSIRHSIR